MRGLGAEIVDPADIPHLGDYDDAEFTVLLYEFKADLNAYLADLGPGAPVHTLADLIACNEPEPNARDAVLRPGDLLAWRRRRGRSPTTPTSRRWPAAGGCRGREGIDVVLEQHKLDAVLAPTGGPPWTTDLVNGDHFLGASSTPAAVSGYPSITVPAGYVFGLPVGVSLIGRPFAEPTLIRLAYAYEQATKVRRPPAFLPTADLSV